MFVLCGDVNAKNAYGGYAGFKPFVAVHTNVDGTFNASAPTQVEFSQSLHCDQVVKDQSLRESLIGAPMP